MSSSTDPMDNLNKQLIDVAKSDDEHTEANMHTLIDAGADINKQDEKGQTVLMIAAQYGGKHTEAKIRMLLAAGA